MTEWGFPSSSEEIKARKSQTNKRGSWLRLSPHSPSEYSESSLARWGENRAAVHMWVAKWYWPPFQQVKPKKKNWKSNDQLSMLTAYRTPNACEQCEPRSCLQHLVLIKAATEHPYPARASVMLLFPLRQFLIALVMPLLEWDISWPGRTGGDRLLTDR